MSLDHSHVPDTLHVYPSDAGGVHPVAPFSEWWLPILGPTASILAATLAAPVSAAGGQPTCTWNTLLLAQRIGLTDNRARMWQSLNRLEKFGVGCFHGTDVFTIRLQLPALTVRQLGRLPEDLAARYRVEFADQLGAQEPVA